MAGFDEYLRNRLLETSDTVSSRGSGSSTGPTYVYMFAHKGEATFTEIFHGGRENYYGKLSTELEHALHIL